MEFFFESCRFLITPQLGYILTGEATETEEKMLQNLLEKRQTELEKIKEYLISNLSLYSALLETNSYFINLNAHLLIARFIALDEHCEEFEIKIYTISEGELPDHYSDKMYLGRDFISLSDIKRKHFGLKHIMDSLQDQVRKLRKRISAHVPEELFKELDHDYIVEVEELIGDLAEASHRIISNFPPHLTSGDLDNDTLVQVNMIFREIKHILMEMEESVRELEKKIFEKNQAHAARYATKFRKDVTNDVNYLTFKVNGRISDHVNGIHI